MLKCNIIMVNIIMAAAAILDLVPINYLTILAKTAPCPFPQEALISLPF
jgi:hypothetical protein